ncbi:unnamed protein product [Amoebophrya sp. A120]|nr:unnamed protein product [Amoebophrya sp. A120]|eukprot:GSA120T00021041001.1
MDERYQSRRKNYKKGIDSEDFRRRRENEEVQIRKSEKEAQIAAKRQQLSHYRDGGPLAPGDHQNQPFGNLQQLAQQAGQPNHNTNTFQYGGSTSSTAGGVIGGEDQRLVQMTDGNDPSRFFPTDNEMQATSTASGALSPLEIEALQQLPQIVAAIGAPTVVNGVLINLQDGSATSAAENIISGPPVPGGGTATTSNAANANGMDLQVVNGGGPVTLEDKLLAVTKIRKLLSIEQNPPIQRVIESGVVPSLIALLRSKDLGITGTPGFNKLAYHDDAGVQKIPHDVLEEALTKICFEAAWALTNIASGTKEQTQVVIDHGAIPVFVRLLSSKDTTIREQAIWALGNISGDCSTSRDLVLNAGALQPIMEQVRHSGSLELLRNATWTISNLCRGRPPPRFEEVAPCLAIVQMLIYHNDLEVVIDACWALAYFCDGDQSARRVDHIIQAGVCKKACELLSHEDYLAVIPALRLVGNICVGTDTQTDYILDCDALPQLMKLMQHAKKHLRKEACWTISNITAGTPRQIQRVIDSGAMQALINLWPQAEFDVRKEIVWSLRNGLASGHPEHLEYFLQRGALQIMISTLDHKYDRKILIAAVEGINFVLERGVSLTSGDATQFVHVIQEADGVEKLRAVLDAAMNTEVGNMVEQILTRYFPEDGDEDDIVFNTGAGGDNSTAATAQNHSLFGGGPQIGNTTAPGTSSLTNNQAQASSSFGAGASIPAGGFQFGS